jgi:uracil phosphoribosyltransferase
MQAREIEHGYGRNVHILADSFLLTMLARIGNPEINQREIRPLLRTIYQRLLAEAVAGEFPTIASRTPTRMAATTEHGYYDGPIVDPDTQVAVACLVRAGVLPSEICYESLVQVLEPEGVRLDFLSMSRQLDNEGRVVGSDESGLKIGGPVRERILLIPDPMGATGGTVHRVLEIYKELGLGPAGKVIVLPMIATPEFIRATTELHPEVVIYTARLDRGLSPEHVLAQAPGTCAGEVGLNEQQYIVPGAGGLGEVLTNSWV